FLICELRRRGIDVVVRAQYDRVGSQVLQDRPDGEILLWRRPNQPRGMTGRWAAPRFLVQVKWEYVTRFIHLSEHYGRTAFDIPLPDACCTELLGRRVAQRAVRPHRVVLAAEPCPLRPRVRHRLELLPLQELVAQAAVKRLDVTVLPGPPRGHR